MQTDTIALSNSAGYTVARIDNTPLGRALAVNLALTECCKSLTSPVDSACGVLILLDSHQTALQQHQQALRIEALGEDVLISPTLGGNGLCHRCWQYRRLAAWAATGLIESDLSAVLSAFAVNSNPLRALWSKAQLELAAERLAVKLHTSSDNASLLQADIIDSNGNLKIEYILPRPDCQQCTELLHKTTFAGLDQQQKQAALCGSAAGIVINLQELPALPGEPTMPVVYSGFLTNSWLTVTKNSQDSVSGKGWTAAEAKIRTMGEAVERYCASFVPSERVVSARAACMSGQKILPSALHGLTLQQTQALGFASDAEQIDWIAIPSRLKQAELFVPLDAVYTRNINQETPLCMPRTTNGLACATTLQEAELRAKLELCERDSFFAAWYGLCATSKIATRILTEAGAKLALQEFQNIGIEINLVHCGSNDGWHTVAACSRSCKPVSYRPAYSCGIGVADSLAKAADAAFLEMAQVYRGLTYSLQAPATQLRCKQLELHPEMADRPIDHALAYSTAFSSAMQAFCNPTPASISYGQRGLSAMQLQLDITCADVASLLGWYVVRALSTDCIPYHVGLAQTPSLKLPANFVRGAQALHPLC